MIPLTKTILKITALLVLIAATPVLSHASEKAPAQEMRSGFMSLPKRGASGAIPVSEKSFSLHKVSRMKPSAAMRSSKPGVMRSKAEKSEIKQAQEAPMPSSSERDKLLLYVYDGMR